MVRKVWRIRKLAQQWVRNGVPERHRAAAAPNAHGPNEHQQRPIPTADASHVPISAMPRDVDGRRVPMESTIIIGAGDLRTLSSFTPTNHILFTVRVAFSAIPGHPILCISTVSFCRVCHVALICPTLSGSRASKMWHWMASADLLLILWIYPEKRGALRLVVWDHGVEACWTYTTCATTTGLRGFQVHDIDVTWRLCRLKKKYATNNRAILL